MTPPRPLARARARIAALAFVSLVIAAIAGCTLAPDHCLRMSDCGGGTTCVEGLCTGADTPPVTLSTQSDASALPVTDAAPSKPVTPVTPVDAAPRDASQSDAEGGAVTDAPPDA